MLTTLSGRNPSQDEWELTQFIELMQVHGMRRYLELGARHGDTFHTVMMALPVNARGVAVDLPGGLWGKKTSVVALENAVHTVRASGRQAHLLLGDTRDPQTQIAIAECGPYDAILIDGDHTYEGVQADWVNYRGLAPLVAFHDIAGDGQREGVHHRPVEVPRLWAKIKAVYQTVEFVAPGSHMGLGCVFL